MGRNRGRPWGESGGHHWGLSMAASGEVPMAAVKGPKRPSLSSPEVAQGALPGLGQGLRRTTPRCSTGGAWSLWLLSLWVVRDRGRRLTTQGPSWTSLPERVGRSGGQGSRVSGARSAGRRPDLDGRDADATILASPGGIAYERHRATRRERPTVSGWERAAGTASTMS